MSLTPDADLIREVETIAAQAAEKILTIYESDFAVRKKSDGSPVTEADLVAHAHILGALKGLDADVPIVSEEDEEHDTGSRYGYAQFWLVDPLDGTRGFTNRNGDFTVNIALVERTQAVLGTVFWPIRGACFSGARGMPATRTEPDGSRREIRVTGKSAHPLKIAITRSRNNYLLRQFTGELEGCEEVRRGSAIKSCLVAEGAADVYPAFSETWYWDTAASQALLEAAGGQLTDLHLTPLRYDLTKGLRNPRFVAAGVDASLWKHAIPSTAMGSW